MPKYSALFMAAICILVLSAVGVFAQSTESAAERAKREEKERRQADVAAENEKIKQLNEVVLRTFKAGNEALSARRYEEAIAQYNEGLAADPEHPGAPVLLSNKSVALRARGVELFNAALVLEDGAAKASGLEVAKKYFRDAAEAAIKAVQKIKAEVVPTEPAALTTYNANLYFALAARAQAMRLLVSRVDPSQAEAGVRAYQEYLAVETAPEKKLKGQFDTAQMLLDAGAPGRALSEFQKILAANPDNVDALLGAGIAVFNIDDKTRYQEAANYLQRFLTLAPDSHKSRADAQAILDLIKSKDA